MSKLKSEWNLTEEKKHPKLKQPIISLLSPGLDSPVSTYLMMRQGFDCASLTFLNGGKESILNKSKMIKIGNQIRKLTGRKIVMHFVDYDDILNAISEKCESRITCVLCKRMMIRTAVALAKLYNANFIINGDILGEQASQTMDNLFAIHQVNEEIPLLRPLIGFNKLDVVKISQKVGLYPFCIENAPACTFNPKYPETRANLQHIWKNEILLDSDDYIKKIIEKIVIVEI